MTFAGRCAGSIQTTPARCAHRLLALAALALLSSSNLRCPHSMTRACFPPTCSAQRLDGMGSGIRYWDASMNEAPATNGKSISVEFEWVELLTTGRGSSSRWSGSTVCELFFFFFFSG